MAKVASSINLERKFWDLIEDYQKKNGFTSRNDAIQLILHEWDILRKIDFNNIKININGNVPISNVSTETNNMNNEPEEISNSSKDDKESIDPMVLEGILGAASYIKPE